MNLLIAVKDENKKSPPPQEEKSNKQKPRTMAGLFDGYSSKILSLLLLQLMWPDNC